MTWTLTAQICLIIIVSGVVLNTVGADLIEKWKK